MIEFAAGIMVGGSVGAVIMGALLSQARAMTNGAGNTLALHARATMQAPRHSASQSTRHPRTTDPMQMLLHGRTLVAATPQLH
jgi:hypothetical protein